jgi:endogenous inhibitor of DNA gyrase (YacG/DUF329 family)
MESKSDKPRIVPCPSCGGDSIFAPSNRWRPFCSARCREHDLGAWASESFRVQAAPPTDDQDLAH